MAGQAKGMADNLDLSGARQATGPDRWRTTGLTLAIFALAVITRIGLIAYPPIYDELYQMLPAQSYWLRGDFSVLDGVYDRAAIFTQLISFSFNLFGEDGVVAARLIPSVIPGVLLVAIIFAWTRQVIGHSAGWIVVVFLLLWPNGIEVSQYVRFYSLQGLLVVVGAIAVYEALALGVRMASRASFLIGALICFLIAFQLQKLTLVSLIGIGLWFAVAHLPQWLRAQPRLWWALGAGVISCAAALISGVVDDTLSWAWTTYNWEPWPPLNDTFFYHRNFRDNYPTFWPLFPIAALIALAARPGPALFCAILFTSAFLLQSFGGLKNIRYLYPVMPFFFVVWATALQAVLPHIYAALRKIAKTALAPFGPPKLTGIAAGGALIVSGLFLFSANAAFERAARMVGGQPQNVLLGKARWTWPEAQTMATQWLQDGAVVVTTEEMLAVEWLGDYDIGYNKPRFSELLYTLGPDTPQFTKDRRTGRPLIGDFNALKSVIACAPVGLFVSNRSFHSGLVVDLIEVARTTKADVELLSGKGAAMLGWRRVSGITQASEQDCIAILPPTEDRAATRILSGSSAPTQVSSASDDR